MERLHLASITLLGCLGRNQLDSLPYSRNVLLPNLTSKRKSATRLCNDARWNEWLSRLIVVAERKEKIQYKGYNSLYDI